MANTMDWKKPFLATNNGVLKGKLIVGILDLLYGETVLIDPRVYSEDTIKTIQYWVDYGQVAVSNDVSSYIAQQEENIYADAVDHVNSNSHQHTVFNGNKAIEVSQINTSGRAIIVEEDVPDNSKAIEVKSLNTEPVQQVEQKYTKAQAQELLSLHWKKFEVEVNKIEDLRILNLILVVAVETNAAEKKKQIVDERLKQLS